MEMYLLQDIDKQKKGVVAIFYNTYQKRPGVTQNHVSLIELLSKHREAMPLRFTCFHTCLYERKGSSSVGFIVNRAEDLVRGISHYGKANDDEKIATCLLFHNQKAHVIEFFNNKVMMRRV
jgi:hypothetical protein